MADLEVRIVNLEPMRVAAVRAVGESPEAEAWEKIRAWAEPKGLFEDIETNPVYGFNNPPPSKDSKEYGYEIWVVVGPDIQPEGGIEVKDFEGGRYAVTRCEGLAVIGDRWMELWRWVKASDEVKWRKTHELEKPLDPNVPENELVFDLYLPIEA